MKEQFIIKLHEIGAIKFGEFTLKSGKKSPFYFDLRDMISYPDILTLVSNLLVAQLKDLDFDYISGIPYTALPIAALVADKLHKPLIYARKEVKTYGTKNTIIGKYQPGKKCVIIDDLISSGESILETTEKFETAGLIIEDVSVIIDRRSRGKDLLHENNYRLHSLFDIDEILQILSAENRLSKEEANKIKTYVNKAETTTNNQPVKNSLSLRLQHLIQKKESNLVLSLDVTKQADFFKILEQTASHIVMLKTHVDILEDFDSGFVEKLREYARKYNFLIFEDRKFDDIGHTVKNQFQKGMYRIADWADFITVHAIPGEGIIHGLFDGIQGKSSFLLAKMSSKGNLMHTNYTRQVFELGARYPEQVSGYIVHANTASELRRLKNKIPPQQLLLMPGVKLKKGTDHFGQQYTGVEEAITGGADLIIVGRGIIQSKNPEKTAQRYRETAWKTYTGIKK